MNCEGQDLNFKHPNLIYENSKLSFEIQRVPVLIKYVILYNTTLIGNGFPFSQTIPLFQNLMRRKETYYKDSWDNSNGRKGPFAEKETRYITGIVLEERPNSTGKYVQTFLRRVTNGSKT